MSRNDEIESMKPSENERKDASNNGGEEAISYREAIEELEQILERIEVAQIDVDELSGAVERAGELLKICRERISKAETRVVQILADIEQEVACLDEEPSAD